MRPDVAKWGNRPVSALEILAVALLLLPAVVLAAALWWGHVQRGRDQRRHDPER